MSVKNFSIHSPQVWHKKVLEKMYLFELVNFENDKTLI